MFTVVIYGQNAGRNVISFLSKGGGMVTKWQPLKDFLRIQTFRRGAFSVLVTGPLGERRVKFDSSQLEVQMCDVLSVCPFAYRPDTFPGVNAVINLNGDVVEMRVLDLEDADRPLESVHHQPLYPLISAYNDDAAPGAV